MYSAHLLNVGKLLIRVSKRHTRRILQPIIMNVTMFFQNCSVDRNSKFFYCIYSFSVWYSYLFIIYIINFNQLTEFILAMSLFRLKNLLCYGYHEDIIRKCFNFKLNWYTLEIPVSCSI